MKTMSTVFALLLMSLTSASLAQTAAGQANLGPMDRSYSCGAYQKEMILKKDPSETYKIALEYSKAYRAHDKARADMQQLLSKYQLSGSQEFVSAFSDAKKNIFGEQRQHAKTVLVDLITYSNIIESLQPCADALFLANKK